MSTYLNLLRMPVVVGAVKDMLFCHWREWELCCTVRGASALIFEDDRHLDCGIVVSVAEAIERGIK